MSRFDTFNQTLRLAAWVGATLNRAGLGRVRSQCLAD